MSFIDDAKPQFEKAIEHLKLELAGLRTGRATPALVENIQVEAYGATQPIKALASISTPDARTVQIEPWDGGVVKPMETAIQKAELGINPNVDGKVIRLVMPMMTDESRQQIVKLLKERLEEAKIAIRQVREDVKKKIEKAELPEDDQRGQLKKLDERTKELTDQIEEMGKNKEEEITTI